MQIKFQKSSGSPSVLLCVGFVFVLQDVGAAIQAAGCSILSSSGFLTHVTLFKWVRSVGHNNTKAGLLNQPKWRTKWSFIVRGTDCRTSSGAKDSDLV